MSYLEIKKSAFIASAEDWGLPRGYTKLSYLQSSTEKEWFDTGIAGTSEIVIQCKVSAEGATSNYKAVCWGETSTLSERTALYIDESSQYVAIRKTSKLSPIGTSSGINDPHEFELTNTTVTMDGVSHTINSSNGSYSSSRSLYIFGINSPARIKTNKGDDGLMRIYWLKIYNGTTLVRDYIPCLNASGIPCFFDRVSQSDCLNVGSGTLTYE